MNKLLLALCAFIITAATSCSSASGNINDAKPSVMMPQTVRVRVLESGTMTYVNLSIPQQQVLRYIDTVFVNLHTHTIDDTDTTTLKCVIYAR